MNKLTKHLCLFLLFFPIYAFAAPLKSIAFYYGEDVPVDLLHAYQVVVVEPYPSFDPKKFRTAHSQAFAYLNIGEMNHYEPHYKDMKPAWFIGRNNAWDSDIVDVANPQWRTFFLDNVVTPLWKKGYQGFFLDTLDTYQLVAKTPAEKMHQEQGLILLIQAIKKRYPKAKLIFNRGFEILPSVHQLVYGLAAESLYERWNPTQKKYETVSKQDREWLNKELEKAKGYGLPVVVIDYLPANKRRKAIQTAKKIQADGYIPWVTTNHLHSIGVGNIVTEPRKVMIIYDSKEGEYLKDTSPFLFIAAPLNYMGYVPEFHDVHQPLPKTILTGRYAGIVVWVSSDTAGVKQHLATWLQKQIKQGMHVAFFNYFGFPVNRKNLAPFGIDTPTVQAPQTQNSLAKIAPIFNYEAKVRPTPSSSYELSLKKGSPLVALNYSEGKQTDMAAITPWGGYVLFPYALITLPDGANRWVVNPFAFLQQALRLPTIPIPDTTTENGLRLLMAHIDGDGSANTTEWDAKMYSIDEIFQAILKKYPIPTTVSVVTGEVADNGLYPELSPKLINIAKKIFQLPWVEIASHSYSHPFDWRSVEAGHNGRDYSLPIPDYRFNLATDITGSINYINKMLAPKGKHCKVFLWTGDTNPSPAAVALTYKDKVANMNGGDTVMTTHNNTLTAVAPLGIQKGKFFQIYAPNQNENVYTNDWTGPYYGYRTVVQTFKLTNKPLRLKPIDIYYHFYSGSKKASLAALRYVYDWAIQQDTLDLFVSEYVNIVLDFNQLNIAQFKKGWLIHTRGELKEFRLSQKLGYPDLKHSQNVIGYNVYGKDWYVHLGPKKQSYLQLQKAPPKIPYLVSSNGRVKHFSRGENGDFSLTLQGHMKLHFTLANMKSCQLLSNNRPLKGKAMPSGNTYYALNTRTSDALQVSC